MTKNRTLYYLLAFSLLVFLFGAYEMVHAWKTEGKNRELEAKVEELQRKKQSSNVEVEQARKPSRRISKKKKKDPLTEIVIRVEKDLAKKKFILGADLPKPLREAILEKYGSPKGMEDTVLRLRKKYEKNPTLITFRKLRLAERAVEEIRASIPKYKKGDYVIVSSYRDGDQWGKEHGWDTEKGRSFYNQFYKGGHYLTLRIFLPYKDYPALAKAKKRFDEAQKVVDLGIIPWFNKKPLPKRRELAMLYLKEGWIKGDDGMAYPLSVALDFDRETWKARVKK